MRRLFEGGYYSKCGVYSSTSIYIYIYRHRGQAARLGWLAPARQIITSAMLSIVGERERTYLGPMHARFLSGCSGMVECLATTVLAWYPDL